MNTSNITGFQRIFKDNFHYADCQLAFTDSLAYVVQEYLYKRRDKKEPLGFTPDKDMALYDFMTLVVNVVFASYSELGEATIKDIIRFLRQSKSPHEWYGDFDIFYNNEDSMVIFNARNNVILPLLWTAYIYTSFRKECSDDSAHIRATNIVKKLMIEEYQHDKAEIVKLPPFKYTIEARDLLGKRIVMKLRKEEEMNRNKDKTKELKEENVTEDRKSTDESNKQDEINRLNREIQRQKEEKEEMIIELLSPIFYNSVEDVREFLQKIENMPDTEITYTVYKWVKDRRISDKSYKQKLWHILNATKLYSSTFSNWNTALRNHQNQDKGSGKCH